MLHSIGNDSSQWFQKWLSVSLQHFESFCQYLHKKKYETLHLNEWYDLCSNSQLSRKNCIVLTFDDGYLDNWVYVFPLLQKYGLKGTIFINPEFVDPSILLRPTIKEVWSNNLSLNELTTIGYLNWSEIKYMDQSETIDIQNHSMSHNYYFRSDKLIDYYNGQEDYHWMAWNEVPIKKPFWITENHKSFLSPGYPIFEYGRSLGIRRFFPSEHFTQSFISIFNEYNKSGLINIKDNLIEYTKSYKNRSFRLGRFETNTELEDRYRYEIIESKNILEDNLRKKIDFLCWPGGVYNEKSLKMSIDAGYKASTIASWDLNNKKEYSNGYKRLRRIALGSFYKYNTRYIYIKNKRYLIYLFRGEQGNRLYTNILRLYYMYNRIKLNYVELS
jgi:peptidoglycan/xylan/chitin deacetylase (PgdA/CDA1 family)